MTASADPNPVPKWAVTMWDNGTMIFVALPMAKGGVPYIMSFPFSEQGLTQAMRILRTQREEAPRPTIDRPANYTMPPTQPMVKHSKAQQKLYSETTEQQRESARKLLEKLGLK